MNAKQQAKAVLDQLSAWMGSANAAIEAGDWHEVDSLARRLRNFERMLRQHAGQQSRTSSTKIIAAKLVFATTTEVE